VVCHRPLIRKDLKILDEIGFSNLIKNEEEVNDYCLIILYLNDYQKAKNYPKPIWAFIVR